LSVQDLPHVNATLNAIATVLIVAGWVLIKRRKIIAHRNCMLAATAVSAVFLGCYLTYHYSAGHVKFTHPGAIRTFYLTLLASHVVLAAITPILVGVSIYRGLTNQIERHRRIARWTMPIWLYVSVTGVLVYLMLYRWYPAAAAT
jgi:uncharacterized membrane protein YozB (DUF420 family)